MAIRNRRCVCDGVSVGPVTVAEVDKLERRVAALEGEVDALAGNVPCSQRPSTGSRRRFWTW